MDDKYYRDLIDKVISANQQYYEILHNENDMRDPIGDGFDYFAKLWNIMNDQDLNVSDETFFIALSICLSTFYGERQDPLPVWEHIAKRYKEVLQEPEKIDSFNTVFLKFLKGGVEGLIPTMELFYELMHLAVDDKNLDIACKLLWLTPVEIECWGQLEEIYENDPEWAAYLECLSDITYDRLPYDPDFWVTVEKLHLNFGDLPNMEKLNTLYERYSQNGIPSRPKRESLFGGILKKLLNQ